MKPNWPLLAALRFVLACQVVFTHLSQFAPCKASHYSEAFGPFAAVGVFFILSGMSIRSSIESRPQGYLARRIKRIAPLYAVSVALCVFYYWKLSPGDCDWFQIILNALMLQTLIIPALPVNGPAWSLSVECIYYAAAPLLKRLSGKQTVAIIVVSAILFKLLHLHGQGAWSMNVGWNPILPLAWLWLFGWLYWEYRDKQWMRYTILCLPVILIYDNDYPYSPFAAWTVLGCMLVIVNSHEIKVSESLRSSLLWLGEISYPLYILHDITFNIAQKTIGHSSPIFLVGAAFVVSIGAYYLVDIPSRKKSKPKETYTFVKIAVV